MLLMQSKPFSLSKQCDESKCGYLDGKEIEHFYKILTTRQEIDVIFEEYAKTKDVISAEDLLNFLNKEQREAVGLNHALALIDKYEPDTSGKYCGDLLEDDSSTLLRIANANCQ